MGGGERGGTRAAGGGGARASLENRGILALEDGVERSERLVVARYKPFDERRVACPAPDFQRWELGILACERDLKFGRDLADGAVSLGNNGAKLHEAVHHAFVTVNRGLDTCCP